MENLILSSNLLKSIGLTAADQKCYTNETFIDGKPQICGSSEPFCCYDISDGQYYCCEENQLITTIRVSAIVLGTLFWITVIILLFCFVFVDFESDGGPPSLEVITPQENPNNPKDEDGFSVIFNPKKDDKKDEKETTIVSKVPEEQNKTADDKSTEKSDSYKPAWGQYDTKPEKKSSMAKIGFKQKGPKSTQSVDSLKEKVTKESKTDDKKSSKVTQTKSFNQNVDKFAKTLNK